MATLIDSSKASWESDGSLDRINAGSFQRIAAATELMAKRYSDLIWERDRYKSSAESRDRQIQALHRKISALKGVITRMRNKSAN